MDKETINGIRLNDQGERVVGGTIRADGSVRKTLKVRPNYRPVEDTKRYNIREVMAQKEKGQTSSKGDGNNLSALNKLLKSNNKINEDIGRLESNLSSLVISKDLKEADLQLSKDTNEKEIRPLHEDLKDKISSENKRKLQRRKKYRLADLDNS